MLLGYIVNELKFLEEFTKIALKKSVISENCKRKFSTILGGIPEKKSIWCMQKKIFKLSSMQFMKKCLIYVKQAVIEICTRL